MAEMHINLVFILNQIISMKKITLKQVLLTNYSRLALQKRFITFKYYYHLWNGIFSKKSSILKLVNEGD